MTDKPCITDLEIIDIRFPTSRHLDGSDAMNPGPDYSAAYVVVHTDDDGPAGHGFSFTIGRGNEVVCRAIEAYRPLVIGRQLEDTFAAMGPFARDLTNESQLRWIGPEKGAIHLGAAAVINAVWDLYAKRRGLPLWKMLAEMPPAQLIELVDFRYLRPVLTEGEALGMLTRLEPTRSEREAVLRSTGIPAYTTSAGWLGYDDDKLRRLCEEAVAAGWSHVKLKVGADIDDDMRRCRIAREVIGPDRRLMIDANQVWDVDVAIANMQRLAEFDPWWIEEPTSPDDILGHAEIAAAIAPIRVATGEHVHNRVMFKQLLQANAIGFCQLDACRLGSINEVVAVLLLCAKFGVPVCPHAGGVGLCELVQHISAFNYIAVAPDLTDVVVEYVDHLHEHFVDPVRVAGGAYVLPSAPGYSAEMHRTSLDTFTYPTGSAW